MAYVEFENFLSVMRGAISSLPAAALFRITAYGRPGSRIQYRIDGGVWVSLLITEQSPELSGALDVHTDFDSRVRVINYVKQYEPSAANFFDCTVSELIALNAAGKPVPRGVLLRNALGDIYGQSDGAGAYTSFSGASDASSTSEAFSAAGIDAIVVATATPMWFPAAGYTKAFIAPSTDGEGVRIAVGGPEAVSQGSDRSVMTADNAAAVLAINGGFWVRRAGTNNCTTALRLGN